MTYLGKIGNIEGQDKLKAAESFPISENGYTLGRLLDGTKCKLLLDTRASKFLNTRGSNPPSLGQAMENVQNLVELKQIMNTELKLNQYSSYSMMSMIK